MASGPISASSGSERLQLAMGMSRAWSSARGGAGGPEVPEECVGAGADQRVEHEVRLRLDDGLDDLLMIRFAHRQVALGNHRPAGRGEALAQDAVVLPRPDVIRADAIGAPADMRRRYSIRGMMC